MTTFQVILVNDEGETVADYLTNEVVPRTLESPAAMLATMLAKRIAQCPRRHSIDTVKVRDIYRHKAYWYWYASTVDGTSSGVETTRV